MVACSGYQAIVCAPTNVAISEVALRFLRFVDHGGPPIFSEVLSQRGVGHLGDIVIMGNGERMKIKGSELEKVYVGRTIVPEGHESLGRQGRKANKIIDRAQRICNGLLPASGWAGGVQEVADFLEGRGLKKYVEKFGKEERVPLGDRKAPRLNIQALVRDHLGFGLLSVIRHGTTLCRDLPSMCLSERERTEILKVVELSRALMSSINARDANGFSNWVKGINPGNRLGVVSSKAHDSHSFASTSARLQQCIRGHPGFDIQGPPGIGKTSTIASLLSVVACSGYQAIVCAPTNVAISEVALRFLRFVDHGGPPIFSEVLSQRGVGHLGDIVIMGNGERMKIKGSELEKVYVGRTIVPEGHESLGRQGRKANKIIDRAQRICNGLLPASGWAGGVQEVADFLEGRGLKKYVEKFGKEERVPLGDRKAPRLNIQALVRDHLGFGLLSVIRHGTTLCRDLPSMCLSERERTEILKVVELSRALMSSINARDANGFSNWVKGINPGNRLGVVSSKAHDSHSFASTSARLQQCIRGHPGFDIQGLPRQLTKEAIGE